MVKTTIEFSEIQIQMLINSIEAALDTEYVPEENLEGARGIIEQLSKYL